MGHAGTLTDESTRNLVYATWGLLAATVVLALATFWVGWKQSNDTKRRDRDAMMREVSRAAHKVLTDATRVEQIAESVLPARARLWSLRNDAPIPDVALDEEGQGLFAERQAELEKMVRDASFVVTDQPDAMSPLLVMSDKELTLRLWNLDKVQVRLKGMRDAITQEWQRYDAESARWSESITAIQAANASRSYI